jgi:hypothetical protein
MRSSLPATAPPAARLVPFSAPRRIGAARQLLAGLKVPATVENFNAGDDAFAADFEASARGMLAP